MCGRFAQYQGMADYLRELKSEQEVIGGYDKLPIERYNVAPQTNVQLLHAEDPGALGDPVRRTTAAATQPDARQAAGAPGVALRRNAPAGAA